MSSGSEIFDDLFFGDRCNFRDYAEETICLPRRKDWKHQQVKLRDGRRFTKELTRETIHKRLNRHRPSKKWLGCTYPNACRFVVIDIDNHGLTETWREQCTQSWIANVGKVNAMLAALSLHAIWTTSPGDIDDEGEHVQGCYCWIPLERGYATDELQEWSTAVQNRFDLEKVEFRFGGKGQVIRIPGQQHLNLFDPATLKTISGDPLQTFLERLETLTLNSLPPIEKPVGTEPKSYVYRKASFCPTSIANAQQEPDTFKRSIDRKIGSRLAWDIHTRRLDYETALQRFAEEMRDCSPSTSRTCRSPRMLSTFCKNKLDWYLKTFSPKMKKSNRDVNDRRRYHQSTQVTIDDVLRYSDLKPEHRALARKFAAVNERFSGRVSCTLTYDNDRNVIATKDEWKSFWKEAGYNNWEKGRMQDRGQEAIFHILDGASHEERKCTQYGFNPSLVKRILAEKQKQYEREVVAQGIHGQVREKIGLGFNAPSQKEVVGETEATPAIALTKSLLQMVQAAYFGEMTEEPDSCN